MRNWGKTPSFLVALNCLCFSMAHADEAANAPVSADNASATAANSTPAAATPAPETAPTAAPAPAATPAAAPAANSADAARDALKQKASDATSDKNLEQVFKATEKTYSLSKKGQWSLNYDLSYSFYRDSRIDIALDPDASTITRLRIQDDAQHSFVNSFDLSYGLMDNLTLSTSLPLIYKLDTLAGKEVTGLGDISVGLRWQPVPLKRGLPTTTLSCSLSTATGDSPYDINTSKDLSTGKGYYSVSAGVSMSKVTDPIVIFGSTSISLATKVSDLNQARGSRLLRSVDPGTSLGASFGFAYSLNYDVSMSASYQHSISANSRYTFSDDTVVEPQAQVSGSVNFSLSLRTSPKRIINLSMGYGLTEDSPDINLGFSMPLEFLGLSAE